MSRVAFVFPGQGSQKLGMGSDFVKNFKEAQLVFDEASDKINLNLLKLCTDGPVEELNRTEITQPAILTMSVAAWRVLESETGLRPDFVAGHSLGEYTAVTVSDGFHLSDAVRLVRKRGKYMQEAVPEGEGAMAAILGMELEEVEDVCEEVGGIVVPANLNCPGQIVISGSKISVEDASELARERGAKRALVLDVSVPSHSPLMEPASLKLKEALEEIAIRDLTVPLVSNAEAKVIQLAQEIKDGLNRQLVSPVLWEASIRQMKSEGVDTYIEIGPGKVLSSLVRRIHKEAQVLNLEDADGLEQIQEIVKSKGV